MNMATSSGQQKMTISDLEAKWKDVPDKYLITIAHILAGHVNETEEFDRFNGPMLKGSIKSVYWIFLIQYALLAILGIAMNVAIVVYILYHRLYKDVTQAFICNLALCHFVQCAIVLPITLMVMLIQNWIFGQFLCFFLPMLQDIPLHVALISHILIAWDRMRWLGDPLKGRLPAFVCCCATWLTGMVIALPYPIYTIYVEIGDFVPRLSGIGLCVINLMDDMHEYMRGLFLIMYCAPSVLLAYLYIRTSQELREPDGSFSNTMFEHQPNLRRSQRNSSNASAERPYGGTLITTANLTNSGNGASLTTLTNANGHTQTGGLSNRPTTRAYDLYSAELDFCREKRNQRNFGTMAATQVLCLCPLMILRMARLSMEETYENQKHFDFMYLMFVWIAFLPTIIFPAIFATQMLPREEQERLRGYFRLSTKRLQKSRSKESGASSSSESTNARKIGTVGSSLHKDVFKNTTLARASFETHNEANAYRCTEPENKLKIQQQQQQQHYGNCESRTRKDYLRHATQTVGAEKDKHVDKFDKADVKIKIISEARSRGSSIASETTSERKKSNGSTIQKLTLETCDNNSFSNMTASTYCNGNSSLLDDGGLSNFGDGEDSSIVSGMIVNSNNYNVTNYSRRPSVLARQKDESVSEVSSLARLNSSTTLERDLEIMDMLEHKRNSDVMEREERHTERRRLPDIEKICQRLPKMNLFDSSTDTSLTAAVASTAQMLSTANVTVNNDPLTTDEAYSSATTSNSPMSFSDDGPMVTDEEVPQDFFDDYKPGSEGPKFPEEVTQYQYTRRHSRHKTPHFGCPTLNSHRNSKRDSFNSLHGNDLIAGAFGELDPTQPLTKMSVIESRMRRSSGRSANFSTNARSSLRSRDLSSTHTMHPELDFRENIFAEL